MSTNNDKSLILNKIKSHYALAGNADLARFLEVKPQTVSSWYSRNTVDYDLIFSKCVDIDKNYLLDDTYKFEVSEPIKEYVLKTDKRIEIQQVPLYSTQAAAGLTKTYTESHNVLEHISIPNLPKCDGAIYITGDSMYPLLKSGDIVVYKRIKDIINGILWGEMYLLSFLLDDEDFTLVKYIQRSEMGKDYVKLVSQNQHHQPKDILIERITALALIKASIRFNSMN